MDRDVSVISFEAYRQFKIYFTKLWKLVCENGWQDSICNVWLMNRSLPTVSIIGSYQEYAESYAGVIINDPVESTDLEGQLIYGW